ncbi:unnamed protein product [Brassicogethes aeneus]|uniref:Tetraspanin n=1 Tax=Brassicogethes aeneus TaxID=1431903 RepID=A0A9P0FDJ9_BRAAE|nr:unnamed protein product [Brassicogethes aeneus]
MSGSCFKKLNLTLITLILLSSIAEILFGVYVLYVFCTTFEFNILEESFLFIPPLVLIILGLFTLFTISCGLWGIAQDVSCCIEFFASVLLVISVLQIGAGVFVIHQNGYFKSDTAHLIDTNVKFAFYQRNSTQLMYNIQKQAKCCGISQPSQYQNYNLPISCCSLTNKNETCTTNSPNLYESGCSRELFNFVLFQNMIVSCINSGKGVFQVLTVITLWILSCCYVRNTTIYKI